MNRPDLEAFATFLDKTKVWDWAVTGSVAMQIHGHVLDCEAAKARITQDVDIVTDDSGLGQLEIALRDGDRQIASRFPPEAERLKFEGTLDVDVIAGKSKRIFGDIHGDTQSIHGLRVMSLPALIKSKTAALDNAKSSPVALVDPLAEAARTATIAKAEADLEILRQLADVQQTPVPAEFAQSYLDHSAPGPQDPQDPQGGLSHKRKRNIFGGFG